MTLTILYFAQLAEERGAAQERLTGDYADLAALYARCRHNTTSAWRKTNCASPATRCLPSGQTRRKTATKSPSSRRYRGAKP